MSGKKKPDALTIAIYGVIVAAILYLAAGLGAALDLSVDDAGKLEFSEFGSKFESTLTDTGEVFSHLADTKSYTFQLTIFATFAVGIYALMKYTSRKRLHRRGVEHGSARWATEKEEKKLADADKKGKLTKPTTIKSSDGKYEFTTDNNILLTQEVHMSLNTRQHRENLNVLTIGGSGSGKSRFYVKPNLMQLNTSYVVTDPKGELLRSCGWLLENAGYEIRVFNLIDMNHSNNYNPFNYVYDKKGELDKSYVAKMIDCLMENTKQKGSTGGDQFWDDSTKALTLAISFYLLECAEIEINESKKNFEYAKSKYDEAVNANRAPEDLAMLKEIMDDAEREFCEIEKRAKSDCNFCRVMEVMKMAEISEQDDTLQSPLDELMEEHRVNFPGSMAWVYYADFKKAPAETAKSILISAAVRFALFELPEVADLTHCDNIQLNTIGDKKTALFVIIPSPSGPFNFLAAMMYTQLFDTLYDAANFKYGGRLPIHVRCLLDEFANIGTIPKFDELLATMRSMEISANVIVQNLAQLKKMYEKSWEVITGNCDSQLFLGGQEASTLESISKSLGKETIDVVSQNRTRSHRNPSTSENNSIMGRELMTPDELKVMKPRECVLMVRAFYPFFCHKFDIEKHPNYVYLEDSNPDYAYLIDDLHTEKSPPPKKDMYEEIIGDGVNDFDDEEPTTDVDVPPDEIIESKEVITLDKEFDNEQKSIEAAQENSRSYAEKVYKKRLEDEFVITDPSPDDQWFDDSKPDFVSDSDIYGL